MITWNHAECPDMKPQSITMIEANGHGVVVNSHLIFYSFVLQLSFQLVGLVSNMLVSTDGCTFKAHRLFS